MRIVVDAAVTAAEEAFGGLGEVLCLPAPQIDGAVLRREAAEALVVRSVTRVDEQLLANTGVRFVGSATAGIDHVDLDCLAQAGIHFASAPGCNADAVAQWVVSALTLVGQRDAVWRSGVVGVVGCGNVGRRLSARLEAAGREVLCCDPPRARAGDSERSWISYEELVARADIMSLHVPLTRSGPDATHHLVDRAHELRLVNTSRGPVVSNEALREWTQRRTILDVWEGEPNLDWSLVANAALASPHVAGYSLDAKLRATAAVHEALCRFAGRAPHFDPDLGEASGPRQSELERDDRAMRDIAQMPENARGEAFRALRSNYPLRN